MSANEDGTGDRTRDRPKPKGRRIQSVLLVGVTVAMVALSSTLVVLYTVPLVSAQRTETTWFGSTNTTQGPAPRADTSYYFAPGFFCLPSNAVGNLTVYLFWSSNAPNTTAVFWYQTGSGSSPGDYHPTYWANNTTLGGYNVPPTLSSFFCGGHTTYWSLNCDWFTSQPGAKITFTGVREYNYTTQQPIW